MRNDGLFKKGNKPPLHKEGCKCFRCTKSGFNKRHSESTKKLISEIQIKKNGRELERSKEWLYRKYWDEGKSYSEISKEIGVSSACIQKWMEHHNIKRRKASSPGREKNGKWKGGYTSTSGYKYITVPLEHPRAIRKSSCSGYVPEHYLVIEKLIGRFLKKEETVHHKNGNKHDNRPENLELLSGQKEHHKLEQKILFFAKQLIWGDLKPALKTELQEAFKSFNEK